MTPVHVLSTGALLLCGALAAHAQGVQRIVGPDGRVTYTDRASIASPQGTPSATAPNAPPATAPGAAAPAAASAPGALPYGLRQAVQRYPVTLYTGDKCNPCNSARDLLQKRGVPFTEKTVTTPDDAQAFAALGVENVLPLITVGPQRISGFQADDISRYLDAAGYPATSQLPRSHRNPAPQALAPVAAPAATAPQAATPVPVNTPLVPATPPAPTGNNPAGIRF